MGGLQHQHTGGLSELLGTPMSPLGTECSDCDYSPRAAAFLSFLLCPRRSSGGNSVTLWDARRHNKCRGKGTRRRESLCYPLGLTQETRPPAPSALTLRGTCWGPASTQSKWLHIVG